MAYVRLGLGILIAVCLLAGTVPSSPAVASEFEESRLYFPWVPNGAVIDDPRGHPSTAPFYGTITVQNLENEDIWLHYKATADPDDFNQPINYHSTFIDAYGARTFAIPQLQLESEVEGTGVIMYATTVNGGHVARISGVQKQAAGQPIDVDAKVHGGHLIVGGYTGLRGYDVLSQFEVYLPIVQTNTNWNTLIRVTSFHSEAGQEIQLTLREAGGGGELQFDAIAEPGLPLTLDLLELGLPEGWIGSATITAQAAIAAVAERIKNETSMLIMNSASAGINAGAEQYLPLVLRDWFDWNTGISLLNLSNQSNDAMIHYYAMDGELVHSENLSLPPLGMNFSYLPSGAGGDDPFVGSAVVQADSEVLGAIDEVKYLGDPAEGAGHAMSYMLEPRVAVPGQWISMPLYQKGDPGTGGGDTTGVQLFNPTNQTVEYGYSFFDQFGNWIPIFLEPAPTLGPKEGATIYAMDVAQLADDFVGTIIVGVHGGGGLTGVANIVNYEVQYDGSASFNTMIVGDPDELVGPPEDFVTP